MPELFLKSRLFAARQRYFVRVRVRMRSAEAKKVFVFKRKITNILFAFYLYLGGIVFEPTVSFRFKLSYCLWSACCYVLGPFVIIFWFRTLYANYEMHLSDVFMGVIMFNAPNCSVLLDLITYFCRHDLRTILRLIDDDFGVRWPENVSTENLVGSTFDVNAWTIALGAISAVIVFCFMFARFVATALAGDENMQDQRYYIVNYPFAEDVNSFAMYAAISVIQMVAFGPILLKGLMLTVFTLYLGGIYYNQFVKLAGAINDESAEWLKRMESDQRPERASSSFSHRSILHLNSFRNLLR